MSKIGKRAILLLLALEETTDVQRNYTGIVKSGDKLVYVENGKIKDD